MHVLLNYANIPVKIGSLYMCVHQKTNTVMDQINIKMHRQYTMLVMHFKSLGK